MSTLLSKANECSGSHGSLSLLFAMKAQWFDNLSCLLARLGIRMAKYIGETWKENLKQFKRNLELLEFFYLDPQGDIQGSFMGIDII